MKIIKQELEFEECLKQRLEFICEFSKVTPTFINGSIRKLERTNLTYIEPHRVIIKNVIFLVFNYYRNKLKNCTDDNLIQEYKEKQNECTTILNKYRKNLKTANYILEDTIKVKEVIKVEMQMKNGQEDITKTKKKDRNLNR